MMIEFRTTAKPSEKEEILASIAALLQEVSLSPNIRTEDHSRTLLIRISFDTMTDARRFTEAIREKQLLANRWVLYENNHLHETSGLNPE